MNPYACIIHVHLNLIEIIPDLIIEANFFKFLSTIKSLIFILIYRLANFKK